MVPEPQSSAPSPDLQVASTPTGTAVGEPMDDLPVIDIGIVDEPVDPTEAVAPGEPSTATEPEDNDEMELFTRPEVNDEQEIDDDDSFADSDTSTEYEIPAVTRALSNYNICAQILLHCVHYFNFSDAFQKVISISQTSPTFYYAFKDRELALLKILFDRFIPKDYQEAAMTLARAKKMKYLAGCGVKKEHEIKPVLLIYAIKSHYRLNVLSKGLYMVYMLYLRKREHPMQIGYVTLPNGDEERISMMSRRAAPWLDAAYVHALHGLPPWGTKLAPPGHEWEHAIGDAIHTIKTFLIEDLMGILARSEPEKIKSYIEDYCSKTHPGANRRTLIKFDEKEALKELLRLYNKILESNIGWKFLGLLMGAWGDAHTTWESVWTRYGREVNPGQYRYDLNYYDNEECRMMHLLGMKMAGKSAIDLLNPVVKDKVMASVISKAKVEWCCTLPNGENCKKKRKWRKYGPLSRKEIKKLGL